MGRHKVVELSTNGTVPTGLIFYYNICIMPWLKCRVCSADFYARPRHIKKGWGKYCSNACGYAGMRTGEVFLCSTCGEKVYRSPKEIRASKSNRYFCDKSCFAVWKNKHVFRGENHVRWKNGRASYRVLMARSGAVPICATCGLSDTRVLVVHHKDQNRENNKLENLKWLCRNCHYLAHEGKTV